ncbi:MAG: copper-binding protein [Burkholderiaceae bacterium]|nr:copper-binding protein [Burkholderiaceae bacterium]
MKILLIATLLAAMAGPILAQQKADERAGQSAAIDEMTAGEVRKVDKAAKKLTIRHAEIRHLDMPAMTMVFQVKDESLLDKVKAGDQIRFAVVKGDSGYAVTDIQVAR